MRETVNPNTIEQVEFQGRERQEIHQAALEGLVKYGAVKYHEKEMFVNVDVLKNWSSKNEIYYRSRKLTYKDLIEALAGQEAYVDDGSGKQSEGLNKKQVVVLPESIQDLFSAGDTGYGENNKHSLLEPWEIGKKHKSWTDDFILKSGEKVNLGEMAIVAILKKWEAVREDNGKLTIIHPKTNKRVVFRASYIKEFAGINPQTTEGKIKTAFDSNGFSYVDKFLPRLVSDGFLKQSDFRTLAGSRTAKEFNVHARHLNPKIPNIGFTNKNGQYANYYIGGASLVGTGLKIDHNYMEARMLDQDTVAIIKDEQGKKIIVAVFSLLGEKELDQMQISVKKRLIERGSQPTASKISQHTFVGEKQMQNLMKEYSITDYLQPRPGENPTNYYKRVKPLDNPDFVLNKVTNFFGQAGIGIHNLPWSEQLVLARALLEKNDEQKLIKHAKKYGLPGVRAFLSLDLDVSLGQKIVKIGENLDAKLARALFEKYGEIVDAASQAAEYIRDHFPIQDELKNHSSQKLTEQLLKKGKDLLAEFADSISQKGTEYESVKLVQKLEQLKTEVLLFAASYKIMPKEAKVGFEDIVNTSIEDRGSASLTEEEKKQMMEIFTLNRLGNYPEKLLEQTQKDFTEILKTPGHTFRMLVHQGRLVAFLHYDQTNKNEIYVGSLNLHPSAKDSPIAIAMLRAALEEKGGENKLKAIVWQNNPAGRFYKMLGFKEIGKIDNYENTGEVYLQLERSPSQDTQMHELEKAA